MPRQLELQADIAPDRQMVEQVATLAQEADMPSAQSGPLRFRSPGHPLAHQFDMPAIGLVEPGKTGQQGRFAAARRACHGQEFTRPQLQADAAQSEDLVGTGMKEAVELDRFERVHLISSGTNSP